MHSVLTRDSGGVEKRCMLRSGNNTPRLPDRRIVSPLSTLRRENGERRFMQASRPSARASFLRLRTCALVAPWIRLCLLMPYQTSWRSRQNQCHQHLRCWLGTCTFCNRNGYVKVGTKVACRSLRACTPAKLRTVLEIHNWSVVSRCSIPGTTLPVECV